MPFRFNPFTDKLDLAETGALPPGGGVQTITGNSGGAVGPDLSNNVNLLGTGSISVVGNPGTNTLTITPSGAIATSFVEDTGSATPSSGIINDLGSGSITTTGSGNTITTSLTGLTNHAVLIGAGTTTITKLGPTATAGQVLQSAGAAADPAFSTATYPSTTTINQILYSSANNVVGAITAANNGTLISGTTGIPSWLANGTTGQVLTATTGSPPSWGAAATGNVVGTPPSTDNAISRYDGITGLLIQNSNAILDDTGNCTFNNTTSTTPLSLDVLNSDTNAASTARIAAAVVNTSAADPFLHVSINAATNYCWGIDNSDSDILKINYNTVSVTPSTGTNIWNMTTAGIQTLPLQPSFLAFLGSTVVDATGAGTGFTLGTGTALTEVFDRGGNFNTNGTFTAPITGIYHLEAFILTTDLSVAMTTIDIRIATSNRTYLTQNASPSIQNGSGNAGIGISALCDMDVNDTATIQITISGGIGNTADIFGQATNPATYFSGYLVA